MISWLGLSITRTRNLKYQTTITWNGAGYLSVTYECLLICVKNRTKEVLMKVIKKHDEQGSLIWTDEFATDIDLENNGYIHQSVNHKKHYVDPITKVHTQGVERAWLDCKIWFKTARGSRALLQSHLYRASWRKLQSERSANCTPFEAFLSDVRLVYCE